MAYTLEEKAVFEYRLKLVKKALKARKIKYYAPVALSLDSNADPQQLRNVMNGGVMNESALCLLERVAGLSQAIAA